MCYDMSSALVFELLCKFVNGKIGLLSNVCLCNFRGTLGEEFCVLRKKLFSDVGKNGFFLDWQKHLGNVLSAGRSPGGRNLIVKQVWAAAVGLNSIGVATSPSNICRISGAPHQATPGARAFTSMAHKGASEVEKDVTRQLKIDVAGKAVEVVGVSGVSDTDIRYFPVLVCLQ